MRRRLLLSAAFGLVLLGGGVAAVRSARGTTALPTLAPVEITKVRVGSGSATVTLSASPDAPAPAIRVDPQGNGDVTTIAEALQRVSQGEIALAGGTHRIDPVVLPTGVSLIGGYDPQTWAFAPASNVTTLLRKDAADDRALVTLTDGTRLGAVAIRDCGTGIVLDGDGVVVIGVGVTRCATGIAATERANGIVTYATLVENALGMLRAPGSSVAIQNSLVLANDTGLAQR